MSKSIVLSLLLLWSPFLIFAQVGIESSNSSSNTCDCSPSCTSLEGDFDCKNGRIMPREDCPCCKVCLRQEGESCDGVNSPCDNKLGLTCSTKGVCEAANIKCKVDSDCPTDRFCVKDICADPCPLLQPCLSSLKGGECVTRGHQPRCECPEGMVANHEVNACLEMEENSPTPSLVSRPSAIGCKVEGDLKNVGESFYTHECKQKCVCEQDGKISCDVLTCPSGLFPAGAAKNKRFCIEIRNAPFVDECCVALECPNNLLQSIHSPPSKHDFEYFKSALEKAAREVSDDDDVQSITEYDYQPKFEELETTLNSNITPIEDDEQLVKDKRDLLKPLTLSENFEIEPEVITTQKEETHEITTVEPLFTEGEKEMENIIPTTEETVSLTTFLLQNHDDDSPLKLEKLFTTPPTTINETTTPTTTNETTTPTTTNETTTTTNETTTTKTTNETTTTTTTTATTNKTTTPLPLNSSSTEVRDTETTIPMTTSPMTDAEAATATTASAATTTMTAAATTTTSTAAETTTTTETSEVSGMEKENVTETTETSVTMSPKDEDLKKGMIMEVTENEKPLHNVSLSNEMPTNETFREGKATTTEDGFKPTVIAEKDHKATMMLHEKFASKPGMLQVKMSTHNSTTLVLPSTLGGVLHYKESRSDIEAMKLTVDEGQSEVTVTGLSPNTRYTFKWAGTGSEGSKGKIEAKTEDGCRHNSISYAVGDKWYDGCQTTCSCHRGGVSECRPRCMFVAGSIQDDQCEEKPSSSDPECCVEYYCAKKDNSVLDSPPATAIQSGNQEGEPKLIVTSRSHNSVTVAWDDFRADNPDRGYVTEYREVPSVEINSEIPWMKKETLRGQPPPTMTIGNLKPNTLYEVRVGIYSQAEERRLIAATETITVRTEPGCVYGNTSFPVGEFFQNCEERCSCAKDGSVKCAGRCTIPYFRKGSFANDPLCHEEQGDDECCVLVMCAHGGSKGGGDYDQCANTVCGKNAECVSWPTLTEASGDKELPQPGSCRCKEGFSGDPRDHMVGCVPDPSSADDSNKCVFRDTSYSPGDVFYDGCSYKCTCNNQRDFDCQPRCKYSVDKTQEETNNSCTYQQDPNDECCKIRQCNSTSDADLNSVPSPAHDFDGCTYGNKTYAKDEAFTFGCDSKCLCLGFSDVLCTPRCPPVKEMSEKEGVRCETLLDPEDECCDVTVCDDSAPDVMKENTTDDPLGMNNNDTDSMSVMKHVENGNKAITFLEHEEMLGKEMNTKSMNETEMESGDMMQKGDNETKIESGDMMLKGDNETEIESGDMMLKGNNETSIDMNVSESEMKNMTSVEDEEGGMLNVTTADELMENSFANSTDEMNSMNETKPLIMFGNDVMFEHENGTQEEDATMIDVDSLLNLTETAQNETDSGIATDDDMEVMRDAMEKNMTTDSLDNETEVTTISINNTQQAILFDRSGEVNLTDSPMKKARFDDMIPPLEIEKITPLDSSTVKMNVRVSHDVLASLLSSGSEFIIASYSHDSLTWTNRTISVEDIEVKHMYNIIFMVPDLEAHDAYQFKVFYKDMVSPTRKVATTPFNFNSPDVSSHEAMCSFKGNLYKPGENFFDECAQYCQCTEDVKVHCEKIKCPKHFGLDIMDPGCLGWEDDPNFVATPPRCCGEKPKCVLHMDHLSCTHMGHKFQHTELIPKELVGCDQRCQCLSGYLDCQTLCGPVEATPPLHLPCQEHEARLVTVASFPCCREWQCSNETISDFDHGAHPDVLPVNHATIHLTGPPTPPEPELTLMAVTDITENSARIVFAIADIFVGLPGGIYLRYTSDASSEPNPLNWESEVIHEDGVIMDRSQWEYVKNDLEPGTNYTMQLALFTHLKRAETVSAKFTVTTLMEVTTPLPRLDLDAKLSVSEIQNTSAKISWKPFNDHELQYIDGIRVRFWPGNKKFPLEGPMLHREADSMILRDLVPDTKYTVDLFFIPHKGLTSTISNTRNITFKTMPKPKDKYAFNITIEKGEMSQDGVQILYSGVPEPEGKFINVYRVVYTTDGASRNSQKFKVPKNQKEGFIMLTDLKPDVQYEVWLEAYLTNGSKKKSNVITIRTKPGELPTPEKSEIAESSKLEPEEDGNYYSAFVAVVILVALACLIILILVFLLFRRQNQAKAHINSSKSNSAYDNPSYKASENQQSYAMELNGLKNTTNGASRAEEP